MLWAKDINPMRERLGFRLRSHVLLESYFVLGVGAV